jgi:CRISPR/Cas system-associated exonuclease Cas4 (RecB family)
MTIEFEGEAIAIVGHIDRFCPEEKAIVEGKTTRFIKWQDENGMLPRERDVLQTQSYYTIWTRWYGFPAEELWLVYVDDRPLLRKFEIEPRDLTEWLTTRTITLHKSILADSPPQAEPNSLCRFCPFKVSCNGD